MHELTGLSRPTILKGIRELQQGTRLKSVERVRAAGGGRKRVEDADPGFGRALERIIAENTAGFFFDDGQVIGRDGDVEALWIGDDEFGHRPVDARLSQAQEPWLCRSVELEEAGDDLLTVRRVPTSPWKALRTTHALERIHEEFTRRTKTQASLPGQDAVLLLLVGLLRTGQVTLRRIDGWQDMRQAKAAA